MPTTPSQAERQIRHPIRKRTLSSPKYLPRYFSKYPIVFFHSPLAEIALEFLNAHPFQDMFKNFCRRQIISYQEQENGDEQLQEFFYPARSLTLNMR